MHESLHFVTIHSLDADRRARCRQGRPRVAPVDRRDHLLIFTNKLASDLAPANTTRYWNNPQFTALNTDGNTFLQAEYNVVASDPATKLIPITTGSKAPTACPDYFKDAKRS